MSVNFARLSIGIFISLLGVTLLFEQFFVALDFSAWGVFTSVVLALLGTFLLTRRLWIWSGLFILISLITLLDSFNIISVSVWRLWPLVLIVIGLSFITNRTNRKSASADKIEDTVIFSGLERKLASPSFAGGNVVCLFGGAEIDLSASKVATKSELVVITAFGGTEIIVGREQQVGVDGLGLFGAFSDERKEFGAAGNKLTVTGFALFGGVSVKNK